jgi:CheY-like chemotaxis protein
MPCRVLVVDDDGDTRDCLKDLLEDLGYEVGTACCGAEAIALATENRYELLLLDFRMPDMTGLETFSLLKDAGVQSSAFLLTGFPSPTIEQRAKELGICEVLQKPLDVAALLARLENLLTR